MIKSSKKTICSLMLCICVLLSLFSFVGCGNNSAANEYDGKPYIIASVTDDWFTSFRVECIESSLGTIEVGKKVYFTVNAIENTENVPDFTKGDKIKIFYSTDHVKELDPLQFDVIYAIYIVK